MANPFEINCSESHPPEVLSVGMVRKCLGALGNTSGKNYEKWLDKDNEGVKERAVG